MICRIRWLRIAGCNWRKGGLTEAEEKQELQDSDPEYGWRECEIENCTNAVRFGPSNTVTYCPGCGRAYKRVGYWGVAIGWFVHDGPLELDDPGQS